MKKILNKFISFVTISALVLGMSGVETEYVYADTNTNETVVYMNNWAYDTVSGHSYEFMNYDYTYEEAKAEAEAAGGYLVCISSEEENNIVFQLINNTVERVWLGYYRDETDPSIWKWEDGSTSSYANWNDGEPNMVEETVAEMYADSGKWNDCYDYNYSVAVIEYDTCKHPAELEIIKDATLANCIEGGYTGDVYCDLCGDKLREGNDIVAGTEHGEAVLDYESVVDVSCAQDGFSGNYICSVCSVILTEGSVIPQEAHTPEDDKTDVRQNNCYIGGYTGDILCSGCDEVLTKGEMTEKLTHEYENNICKHCGRIKNAVIGQAYTSQTSSSQLYQVIEFTAPNTGTFGFYCENTEYWDGFGYLFDKDVDEIIVNALERIKTSEDTRLSGYISSDDDSGGDMMPYVICELEKDKTYYFVMGGYGIYDYGEFNITIDCVHENTEIRNKDIISCEEGGYTGDTYCTDCNKIVETGTDLPAGTEHSLNYKIISEAVCNAYQKGEYSCDNCDYVNIIENQEAGYGDHSYKITGYVEETCTKDGQTGLSACEYCGLVEYENTVIKAYHSQTDEDGYNPNYKYDANLKKETCMADGYTGDVICLQCDEVFEKGMTISAIGHNFSEGICENCGVEENLLPISNDGYYEIDSADDLVLFMMNSHRGIKGKVVADIVVPDNYIYEGITDCEADNSLLDGGYHTISNWNLEDTYYLFELINNSVVKNLTIEVQTPENNDNNDYFGVIAIEAYNSTFENITINGTIINKNNDDYQGGIVGYAENCKFINCTNNANITVAGGNVGGIVGDGDTLLFINCVNNGNIHANEDEVGGIAGQTYNSTFTNCKNTGKITTNDQQAGGIVGIAYDAKIDGCTNDGDVQHVGEDGSPDEFGGIVGVAYDGSEITNCVNNGNIGGPAPYIEEAGGIAGQMYYGGKIIDCTNNGNISAPSYAAGGIVGDYEHDEYESDSGLEIIGCTNNGDVYSYDLSAGIIGRGISVKVEDCVNNGDITGEYDVAGIIGYAESATVNNVYNTGKIGDGTGAGLVNGDIGVTITNSEENHTHMYDIQKVIKPATETTDGEAENFCKCGASGGKTVLEKTGLEETTTKEPTTEKPTTEKPTTKVKKPAKTKIKSIKNIKTKKIKLTWKKIKGVKGYQVRYSTNKKFKKAKIKTIKSNTAKVTLKKLKKKKYYVQVRAYKVAKGKKIVGKWSNRKSIKVKR